jgi:hypothetical protein
MAIPPTTPPTIAPTSNFLIVTATEVTVRVGAAEVVGVPVPVPVPTKELEELTPMSDVEATLKIFG